MNPTHDRLKILFVIPCLFFSHSQSSYALTQAPTPIAVTGFNRDVVTDANISVRFAASVDIGTASWFETGAVDNGGTPHSDGLTAGTLLSAFTNSVTGGHTEFQLQSFSSNNALIMQYPSSNTGSLVFTTPAQYRTLSLLSAGYNAASNAMGSMVINFADGTHSQALSFIAFDWGFGQTNIAIDGRGRNFDHGADGKQFNYNQPVPFKLYETDLDLEALGLSSSPISSLTFTGATVSDQPGVPNHGPLTSIFAVSGLAVPEQSTLTLFLFGTIAMAVMRLDRRLRYLSNS